MATYEVRLPQLGETVAEGTIVAWLKKPGEEVTAGEPLFEVATDKVDTEVESAVSGTLGAVLAEEGDTVAVGAVVAEITLDAAGADREAEPAPAPGATASAAVDREAEAASAPGATDADLRLSPLVRRLIDEHGLDVGAVSAFAGGERITRKVVDAYVQQHGAQPPPTAAEQPPSGAAAARTVPFSRIRSRTAEHMRASLTTSAHVATAVEVDFEAVARARSRPSGDGDVRLTYLPFVAFAVARTLPDFERLNASVSGESLVVHPSVHLGVAVDLEGEGLVVPVIRDATGRSLLELAREMRTLADRARSGELGADDLSGGTFTVTGQGPYGTLFTTPIINQPQVAILSVDGIRKRPVVVEDPRGDDEVAVHHTGVLTLSWDHRAVDGLYAAAFLAALRERIETSDWAAEV